MEDVQGMLQDLRDKGWTYAAIADEVGVEYMTVWRWAKGRVPANSRGVATILRHLGTRRRIPKQRRVGSGRQRNASSISSQSEGRQR